MDAKSNLVAVEERDFAFEKRLQTFSVVNRGHIDVDKFMTDAFDPFERKIKSIINQFHIVKVSACFCADFEKISMIEGEGKRETQPIYIHTAKGAIVDTNMVLKDFYDEFIVSHIMKRIDDFEMRGSGFTLSRITELNIQVSHYDVIAGSTYIKLPKFLQSKKAIVNVQNNDNECFKYAVLSALYPAASNPHRATKYYEYMNTLDFTDIQFPVEISQIRKFEEQNPTISINVYMFDDETRKVQVLQVTDNVKVNHIHLLLLQKASEANDTYTYHYCWIKNLSALISTQLSSNRAHKHICDRCLNYFVEKKKLEAHQIDCAKQNICQIKMPTIKDNKIVFKQYKNELKVPFIIYADLETLLKKPEERFCESGSTHAYQQHEVYSVGYYFKCSYDDNKSYYRSNRGTDCIDWFVEELKRIASEVELVLDDKKKLELTAEENAIFAMAVECHICGKRFEENDVRHRDHSHLTGQFRGAAHENCNLLYRESRTIPIVFHNLSHYDSHFLIKKLAARIEGPISLIPQTDEVYISFTQTVEPPKNERKRKYKESIPKLIKLRFIDSFRFMSSSLDHLSSLLPSEKKKIVHSEFHEFNAERIQMLERKGVFPYDYVDSWSKLDETTLPPKSAFFSKLTESEISDDDYEFATNVYNKFEISTLGEYSDLYLKTDVLLLADVFENFRETCLRIYELDPAHYFTAPGLSFDAMLKYTKVEIEILTDIDMLLFIERGVRGGISQCSKRYVKSNNKYVPDFDPSQKSTYLMYLDCNNLYGYSMMQHLPISDFAWCHEEFDREKILQIPDDSPTAYIFEVTLLYPQEIHDKHKFYPLCAENCTVPGKDNVKKLLLTLNDKTNYVIHYKMLKFVLEQGLILKKIHRVIQFKQTQWLKSFIELNTEQRQKATNDFEKNFFKLMVNSIYGKTMENLRRRVDIKLKKKWNGRYGARKLIAQPNFKKFSIFDENLVAIELNTTNIFMNKCITVGFSVLDLSKIVMADFFYNYMQKKYGDNVSIAYTDTDSFILEIETDDFYEDMRKDLNKYDTSDYTENNIYNIERGNTKVPGVFKDELNGTPMQEFVGLRSKMYCIKASGVDEIKKSKGVKKYVIKKDIIFEDYLQCIRQNSTVVREQNTLRSKKHKVFSISQSKVALSPFDDKRHISENNVDTLPWGHYKLN